MITRKVFWHVKVAVCLVGVAFVAAGAQPARSAEARPKYIFLFIGDGMGANHRRLAELALNRPLAMNHLPVSGTTTTHNAKGEVTDSAAAGTAIACGVKTRNGMLDMAPDGSILEAITAKAKKAGMGVGILTTASIEDATPAAFYAHADSRSDYKAIAFQLADSGFDFFGGGGFKSGSSRASDDLWRHIRERGYSLFPSNRMPVIACRRLVGDIGNRAKVRLSLAQLTAVAIRSLDQEKGFFMMVEGGDIDGAGHASDGGRVISEVEKLDNAVQEALTFLAERPGECLVVVTADHETGGLTIADPGKTVDLLRQTGAWHTFRDALEGMAKTNAAAGMFMSKVKGFFQLDSLAPEEEKDLLKSWEDYLKGQKKEKVVPPAKEALRIFNRRCGIAWTSGGNHTTNAVQTTASGVGAEAFAGNYDNTDIFRRLEKLLPAGRPDSR